MRNAERGTASAKAQTQDPRPKSLPLVRPLLRWFAAHARDLPWRRTLDPYAIWISEIMLQQTQVKTVIPYYERWLRELPDVRALATAPPERVLKLWEGLGYYTRARNLQKAAQQIVREHGGEFPREFDAVLALPGIGRYTVGAITSIAFNQPAPLLDGNVIRVLCRLFAIRDNPRDKAANARLWELATGLVAAAADLRITNYELRAPMLLAGRCSALNQSLMELGATICTPRQPDCAACPLRRACAARAQGLVEQLPNLAARATSIARRFAAFVVERRGRVLVRQRPAGVVNAHLWEFPNVELPAEEHGSTGGKPTPGPSQEGKGVRRRRALDTSSSRNSIRDLSPPPEGAGVGSRSALEVVGATPDPEEHAASPALAALTREFPGLTTHRATPLCTIKHSITRYRITVEAVLVKPASGSTGTRLDGAPASGPAGAVRRKGTRRIGDQRSDDGRWIAIEKLDHLAFTSAHRKILRAFLSNHR